MYTSERMKNIASGTRGVVYKEAIRVSEAGEKVLKINTGNPAAFGFPVPESIKKAIEEACIKSAAYTESAGLAGARKAILEYNLGKGFKDIELSDIFLGNGVSELAEMVCLAMLNPGDELLCPSPGYNLWSNSAAMAGAVPVSYECFESLGWKPTAEDIENRISEKTKAIVLVNPNNPTGAIYDDALLKAIADVAKKHGLIILSDEIYDRLVMDDMKATSIASLAPDQPIITFNGLSKSHIACGLRCGWLCMSGFGEEGNELKSAIDALASVRLCPNTIGQYCVEAALKDPIYTKEMMNPGGLVYERREACINAVNQSEYLSVIKNHAALYCFVRIDDSRFPIENDQEFAMELVREKHIMIVPGSGFDYPHKNYFRIVMLPTPEELEDCVRKIDEFCREKAGKKF